MGWRTDWLYQLIFAEIETVWNEAQKSAKHLNDIPPIYFRVNQWSELGSDSCRLVRQWIFNEEGIQPYVHIEPLPQNPGKHFYLVGSFNFDIFSDRKRVHLDFVVGPRYGRGIVYAVVGQGNRGKFKGKLNPNQLLWLS